LAALAASDRLRRTLGRPRAVASTLNVVWPALIAYLTVMTVAAAVAIVLLVIGIRKQVLRHGFGSGLGPEARTWVLSGAAILAACLLLAAGSWIGIHVVVGDRIVFP
jgi:hypothetical protein